MAEPAREHPHWIDSLTKDGGFVVQFPSNVLVRISKHGCAAVLESSPGNEPRFVEKPGLETKQGIAHLLDRGFQKFWQEGERQFPALAAQLQALHRFDQDLRAVMGLTALYNEALGTVSSRYVYDRLEGREKGKRHPAF